MRIIAILFVMMGWRVAAAERAKTIASGLDLDPAKTARVTSTLRLYDGQLIHLRDQRADLRRRMLAPGGDSQRILNESIANARALLMADEMLVAELRMTLTAEQTVHVMVLLSASEPEAPLCDPFKQMHRCPN